MPLSYLQKEKINAMKNKDVRRKNVLSEIIDTCQKATITPKGRLDLTAELVNESLIKYQKMVHMCDLLASRKFINVNFNNNRKKE